MTKEQFITGGDSRPRNEIIMKFFRLLGASERQGFGGPLIFKTAQQNDFRRPEIVTNLERTELKVWNIDLVDSYPELSNDEKTVLRYYMKNSSTKSIREIAPLLKMSEYRMRNAVASLEKEHFIRKWEVERQHIIFGKRKHGKTYANADSTGKPEKSNLI